MQTAIFVYNVFSTCCPIPFNKAVPCLLDLQNKGVMRTDKLKRPEDSIGEGAEVSSIRNETLLL